MDELKSELIDLKDEMEQEWGWDNKVWAAKLESIIDSWESYVSTLKSERDEFERKADALLNHCDKERGECSKCSEICCPYGSKMHFHHDGCPICAIKEEGL